MLPNGLHRTTLPNTTDNGPASFAYVENVAEVRLPTVAEPDRPTQTSNVAKTPLAAASPKDRDGQQSHSVVAQAGNFPAVKRNRLHKPGVMPALRL